MTDDVCRYCGHPARVHVATCESSYEPCDCEEDALFVLGEFERVRGCRGP